MSNKSGKLRLPKTLLFAGIAFTIVVTMLLLEKSLATVAIGVIAAICGVIAILLYVEDRWPSSSGSDGIF